MHRVIAGWLTQRSWRAVVAAAFCGALSPWMPLPFLILAGAIPALVALCVDVRLALGAAMIAATAAAWVLMPLVQPVSWTLAGISAVLFSATGLAILWRRTGSPNLCFQVAVLGSALALILFYVSLPDATAAWAEQLTRVLQTMVQAGLVVESEIGAMARVWARTMWGALAAVMLGAVLAALFLGRWWASLLQSGEFGVEFRGLRLGRVLGSGVTVLFMAALWFEFALLDSLAWVALAGLSFQGLAAAHRSRATGRLNRGWLTVIYVLLLMPLSTGVTVFVLALWGFADNWLHPKAQSA